MPWSELEKAAWPGARLDNKACHEGALLKWQRADSDRVGWSQPAPDLGVIALRKQARGLGWSPHPDHRHAGDLVERGVEVAGEIAQRLAVTPRSAARFLSSYRPAGDFNVDEAVHQFQGFWDV